VSVWREMAGQLWSLGDHEGATFAHGQALRSEVAARPEPTCAYCGVSGHSVAACPTQAKHWQEDMDYERPENI
jgi:hypothetical protein